MCQLNPGRGRLSDECVTGWDEESVSFLTQQMNTTRWFLPSLGTSNSLSIGDDFSGRRRVYFQRPRGMALSLGAWWSNAAAEVVYGIPEITRNFLPFSYSHWRVGAAQKATLNSDLQPHSLRAGVGYCCISSLFREMKCFSKSRPGSAPAFTAAEKNPWNGLNFWASEMASLKFK